MAVGLVGLAIVASCGATWFVRGRDLPYPGIMGPAGTANPDRLATAGDVESGSALEPTSLLRAAMLRQSDEPAPPPDEAPAQAIAASAEPMPQPEAPVELPTEVAAAASPPAISTPETTGGTTTAARAGIPVAAAAISPRATRHLASRTVARPAVVTRPVSAAAERPRRAAVSATPRTRAATPAAARQVAAWQVPAALAPNP